MSAARPLVFTDGQGKSLLLTFCLVSSLFLLWGFCNGLIDVMDKHFQEQLHLSLAQSAWVRFAHYLGYFLMALPAGGIAIRFGYRGGIIAGLLMVAAGGLWFLVATRLATLAAFLFGVAIIAAGLAFLETVANPYTTVLGHPRFAALRINLAQACNGIGWVFGPIVGSVFFYSIDAQGQAGQLLYVPYVAIAGVVLVLAVLFLCAAVPDTENNYSASPGEDVSSDSPPLWRRPHFTFAVAAQFFYVAAQAGIFSFFINYMTSQVPAIPDSVGSAVNHWGGKVHWLQEWLSGWFHQDGAGGLAISNKGASNIAAAAFVCFLAGRVSGAALLKRVVAHRLLALYGMINVVLALLVFLKLSWLSVACLLMSYFFMSIMFPTIFALGIHGLGMRTKRASAYLVMAIVGGALLPKLMGYIADRADLSRAFVVPMVCFGFVALYGLAWPRLNSAPTPFDGASRTLRSRASA